MGTCLQWQSKHESCYSKVWRQDVCAVSNALQTLYFYIAALHDTFNALRVCRGARKQSLKLIL